MVKQDYEVIADGSYRAFVHSVNFIEKSKSSGRPCVKFEFVIEDPPYQNRHEWKYIVTDVEWGKKQARSDLKTCGIDFQTLRDLEKAVGAKIFLGIKTSLGKDGKEYRNRNLKKRIEENLGERSSIETVLPF